MIGLLCSSHWARGYLHGYAEPLAIALLLVAVERHWSRRRRQALLLAVGVALVRPEAFPLVLLYALRLCGRRQLRATGVIAAAVSVPSLWLIPDWIGSGDPFHGGRVAGAVRPHGIHAAVTALGDAASITPIPLSLAAIAGLVVAYRIGDRRVTELSALAAAWSGLLTVLLFAGYPVVARFYALPAAVLCVLGAPGAVRAVRLALARTRPRPVIAAVALGTVPLVAARAETTAFEARNAVQRAQLEASLGESIAQAGGARLRICGTPVLPRGLGWLRGEVAWRLELPLNRVRSVATTGDGYLAALSARGTATLPSTVAVRTRRRRLVFLAPFGPTRLRLATPDLDLITATRAGRWRLLLSDSRGCANRRRAATKAA